MKKTGSREFWVDLSFEDAVHHDRHTVNTHKAPPRHNDSEVVHVIEYSAYEELRNEVEQLKTERDNYRERAVINGQKALDFQDKLDTTISNLAKNASDCCGQCGSGCVNLKMQDPSKNGK